MIYFQIAMTLAAVLLASKPALDWWKSRQTAKPLTSGNLVIAPTIHQGVIVDDSPTGKLREALKLIACHIACEVDDAVDQADALAAVRTLKRFIPQPPSGRPEAVTDQQAAVLAAVTAYNAAADKYTAVG